MKSRQTENHTLGPLLKVLMNRVWTEVLFVPGSIAYLPDLIKNGDSSYGIESYDPAMIDGKQPAIAIDVPQKTRDMACISLDYPVPPVGLGNPTLTVENLKLLNLHAVERKGGLSFPPGYKVTGTVTFGLLNGKKLPLKLESQQVKADNYEFSQACCVPKSQGGSDCVKKFANTGTGYFDATISDATGTAIITINTEKLCVDTIDQIKLTILPKNLEIKFTINQDGGPIGKEGMLAFAKAAVETGIAHNEVQHSINNLLNSKDLRDNMVKIINKAIEGILPSVRTQFGK